MRRNWLFIFAMCAVFFLQSFAVNSDEKINFRVESWGDIGKVAKAEEKLIFVMISANWCPVCKKMEKVLDDAKIGGFYNENFISTRFFDDNAMQKFRADNWGVVKVPAMVFLDEKRNIIYKTNGYKDPAAMLAEAKIALEKKGKK
ncbi:MAG: thioredoxin family protein [Bacteroidia bacterium]